MTIFDFKKTKAGMTLVEMVISLVVLSILMTSTMGMIISSSNLFISTSMAALDRQVGNHVVDLMTKVLRYSTHLTIRDVNDIPASTSSQQLILSVTDTDTDSGFIKYKSATAEEATNLYADSFYGIGGNKRTINYTVEEVGNTHQHLKLTVSVFREGKLVFKRSEVIKCVNLALITTGADKNLIVNKSTAGTSNQCLVFSVDEQLISGGSDAYSLEYKLSEYIAKYNTIQKLYASDLNKALGTINGNWNATTDPGLKGTKNGSGNRMPQADYIKRLQDYYKIIFGDNTTEYKYDENDITKCRNLRLYYQEQIKELLTFMPTAAEYVEGAKQTVTTKSVNDTSKGITYDIHSGDPYYGVVATKEELYAGFMLLNYDENGDGTVTQKEFPAFTDPDTFFAGTSIATYIDQTSTKNSENKMVVLAYCVDNVTDDDDDTTNKEYKLQLQSTSTENVYATDGTKATGLAMVEGGVSIPDTTTYNQTSANYIVKTVNSGNATSGDFASFKLHQEIDSFMYYKWGTGGKGEVSYKPGRHVTMSRDYDFSSISQIIKWDGVDYKYSQDNLSQHIAFSDHDWESDSDGYSSFATALGALTYSAARDDLSTRLTNNGSKLTNIKDKVTISPDISGNKQQNPSKLTLTVNENLPEGVYYLHLKYDYSYAGYANENTNLIFVLRAADTLVDVSSSGVVTATSTPNDITSNRIAVPKGGTITLNLSNYSITSTSYTQAQYTKADSGATYEIPTNFTTYYAHQFIDYAMYGVDWNSWFTTEKTGLINKLLTGTVSFVQQLFGRTYNTNITGISGDNAVKSLGNAGKYDVNGFSTSTSSYNMAYCVYVPSTGTWYYLPSASTRLSNTISKISFTSSKDQPTPIDVELQNGETWYNSTAMSYDIKNRKLSSSGLFGLVDTTKDQNWVSLPTGNQSDIVIEEDTTAAS